MIAFTSADTKAVLSGACVFAAFTVAVGDLVVVLSTTDGDFGTEPTISDNLVNTWTALTGPNSNGARMNKWYTVVTVAGSMVITLTASVGGEQAAVRGLFTGAQTSPLDRNPANVNDNTSPFDCPSSGVLAQADEAVIGFRSSGVTGAIAATSPDLLVGTVSSSGGAPMTAGMSYRIVAATTAIVPQLTGPGSVGINGTASFKAVGLITPGTGSLALSGIVAVIGGASASLSTGSGALAIVGAAPTLTQQYMVTPLAGALAVLGVVPSLERRDSITPPAGVLTLTGVAPTALLASIVMPNVGGLEMAGGVSLLVTPPALPRPPQPTWRVRLSLP